MNKKAEYRNRVPEKILKALLAAVLVLLAAAIVTGVLGVKAAALVCGVLCLITVAYLIYMYACHELFAFGKGNMMAKIHEHLVEHLNWDGRGKLIDIGRGGAALTIRFAKAFPDARITGMDHRGSGMEL